MTEDRALRVALTTLGCKVNFAEMAELAGTLAAAGVELVAETDPADVRVINSCTVTLQADATTRQRLARLRRQDPDAHIVITGCSVDANPGLYQAAPGRTPTTVADAVFDNASKATIADHILALAPLSQAPVATPRALRSRAFIKLQDGCDHRCTYCIVWRARGASRSLTPDSVCAAVDAAMAVGHRELVLTGVDLGSYGREHGTSLGQMVKMLLTQVGSRARLRLSSVNSNDIGRDLIDLADQPALCHHWHMPLQSGSDSVLRAMHRGYRRGQFLRIVSALRQRDPDTEFTTDIMVGFPGETEADHAATLSLVDEVELLQAHVFRWSPRPDTAASELEGRVPAAVARHRSAEVIARVAATAARRRAAQTGRTLTVVWDRVEGRTGHGFSAGYHEVVIENGPVAPGQWDQVAITTVDGAHLRGTLLRR